MSPRNPSAPECAAFRLRSRLLASALLALSAAGAPARADCAPGAAGVLCSGVTGYTATTDAIVTVSPLTGVPGFRLDESRPTVEDHNGRNLTASFGEIITSASSASGVAAAEVVSTSDATPDVKNPPIYRAGNVTVLTTTAVAAGRLGALPDNSSTGALILNQATGDGSDGDHAGLGTAGAFVSVTAGSAGGAFSIGTLGSNSAAILTKSYGGAGGNGDDGQSLTWGSDGGSAAAAGPVTVTTLGSGWLFTSGAGSMGLVALSVGGNGGAGGHSGGVGTRPGSPGSSGAGGSVSVSNAMTIQSSGSDAVGILA